MPPSRSVPDNHSFQQALCEYRERTWCPDDLADLPTEVQCDIVERASRIQAAGDSGCGGRKGLATASWRKSDCSS
jgi:hypothetical protein